MIIFPCLFLFPRWARLLVSPTREVRAFGGALFDALHDFVHIVDVIFPGWRDTFIPMVAFPAMLVPVEGLAGYFIESWVVGRGNFTADMDLL
jgi:hypothetical protein